jgi:hypothetical protein
MKAKRLPSLDLGQWRALDGVAGGPFRLPAHHLVTHGVVLGMTGSGKTGLLTVMIEEALRSGVPVLVVLGVLLEEVLSWVRGLPGSQRLRALIVFDEVYGFLPPHPANPPTKRPLVALMKQARAFGVGVVVATQNPMDLDYRALGNAGLWCLGRLQTDADRARVLDGLGANGIDADESLERLGDTLRKLGKRWFVVRDAHSAEGTVLMQPRWAMSFMKGPMTRSEIRAAIGTGPGSNGVGAGVAAVPADPAGD